VRPALNVALKDLRQKMRDRSALLVSIVAPFALAVLFSMILGGLEEDFHAHWGYVDLDGGQIAAALGDGPISALEAQGVITVERFPDEPSAREAVASGEVEAAIVVPAGFSVASMAGSGATVELLVDPDATISTQVARSLLAGFASEVDAVQLSVRTALVAKGGLPDAGATTSLAEQASAIADPVTLVDLAVADRTAGYTTYYAAAMAILFVFLSAQFGIVSIHAERRMKTLARMVASPIPWWSVLVGKLIVSIMLALVSMGVIIAGTGLLLGATWGDPLALAALVLAAALAATGVSLLVVAFTRNEDQAGAAISIVSITLAVIGGSFFPANQGPELLSQLSQLTPHAWFLDGVNDISTGGDLGSAATSVAVLATIGLVTGTLGLLRSRRLVLA
jgi:linearmycin/streptolysin S transport system permease protein